MHDFKFLIGLASNQGQERLMLGKVADIKDWPEVALITV